MGWVNRRCDKGHNHLLCAQNREQSCGPACMAMVINRVKNRQITEAEMRQASQDFEGGYRPGHADAGAQVGDRRQAAMAHILRTGGARRGGGTAVANRGGYMGTAASNLANTLSVNYGINATHRQVARGAVRDLLKKAKSKKPIIALVSWGGNGGGHFVLVDRMVGRLGRESLFCICDPIYGVHTLSIPKNGDPTYEPRRGVRGTFNGHLVTLG